MFKSLKISGGLISSLIVVAAVLPIVLVATMSEDLRLQSFANQNQELRIWTEPKNVVVKTGREFSLKVYAEAKNGEQLIPKVKLSFQIPEGMSVKPDELEYASPFYGKVLVGEIRVKADRDGELVLGIPEGGVFSQLPDLRIVTQGTGISAHN